MIGFPLIITPRFLGIMLLLGDEEVVSKRTIVRDAGSSTTWLVSSSPCCTTEGVLDWSFACSDPAQPNNPTPCGTCDGSELEFCSFVIRAFAPACREGAAFFLRRHCTPVPQKQCTKEAMTSAAPIMATVAIRMLATKVSSVEMLQQLRRVPLWSGQQAEVQLSGSKHNSTKGGRGGSGGAEGSVGSIGTGGGGGEGEQQLRWRPSSSGQQYPETRAHAG